MLTHHYQCDECKKTIIMRANILPPNWANLSVIDTNGETQGIMSERFMLCADCIRQMIIKKGKELP